VNHSTQPPIHTTLQLLFIGLLIGGSFWVLQPFLLALIWATIIVVATWPLLLRVQSVLWNRRGLAVAVMIPASMLSLIAPLTLAVVMVVKHSGEIGEGAQSLVSMVAAPPPWVERIPMLGSKITEEWRSLAAGGLEKRVDDILPFVDDIVAWFVSKAGGLGMMIVNLLLTMLFTAILYLNGESAAQGVRRFARRFGGAGGENTIQLAAQAIRGVALGVIGTAIIQAIFAGIGLVIAGVPFAATLTAIMVVLGIAQIGATPVLVPAVIWLYWTGHPGLGTFLLVWTVVTTAMDNLVRPMLIKSGVDLPLLLITAGVIGGLIAFGVIGLFVGPVVLAVSYTLLVAWIQGDESGPASGTDSQKGK
jgi:predicted PurR-regulated permease PerM